METEKILITSEGLGFINTMDIVEKAGVYGELGRKEIIRLRLLAEELIGMMRGVAGDIEAYFWITQEDKSYELHLKSDINMSQERHKRLVDLSTSKKNAAVKGFMSKLNEIITVALLPVEDENIIAQNVSLGIMTMGGATVSHSSIDAYMWSLQRYKSALDEDESEDAKEEWDELEKSIVASIADEVKVSVKGSTVEIVIYKNFGE